MILTVFRHECLRYRERRNASDEWNLAYVEIVEAARPDRCPSDGLLLTKVLGALERLKIRDQSLLRERFLEELPLSELATRFGVRPRSMKNLLARASARWRKRTGASGEDSA